MSSPFSITSADGSYTADPQAVGTPIETASMYPDIEIRALKNYIANLPGVVGQSVQPVRNTVISGKVTKQRVQYQPINLPSFLAAGAGFTLNILASATALVVTYAHGNSMLGNVDYGHSITADSTVTLFQQSNNYIYTQRDPVTGAQSFGVDYIPPQTEYDGVGVCPPVILHFDNDFTNAYGGPAWTNNAVTFNAGAKFGSYAGYFNGTSAYIENPKVEPLSKYQSWSKEFYFKLGSTTGINQALYSIGALNGNSGILIGYNLNTVDNKFTLYHSSAGTSWDLADGIKSTLTLTDTTSYHHLVYEFDGSSYKLYIDGVVWITLPTTAPTNNLVREVIGAYCSGTTGSISRYFLGYIDEYRSSCKPRYLGAFTPPTAAFTPDETYCVFDIPNMVMRQYGATQGILQRVYIGEAVTNATSITSVNCYAFQGKSRVLLQDDTTPSMMVNVQHTLYSAVGSKYINSNATVVWKMPYTVNSSTYLPGDSAQLSHASASGTYMRPLAAFGRDSLRSMFGMDGQGAGCSAGASWFIVFSVVPQALYEAYMDVQRAF